jgi:hypothetical protein
MGIYPGRKISVLLKISQIICILRIFLVKQKDNFKDLKEEFKEWDKLSDEALNQFEKKL